jgi:glycosyltransferase involved in cell wall biosynthesis
MSYKRLKYLYNSVKVFKDWVGASFNHIKFSGIPIGNLSEKHLLLLCPYIPPITYAGVHRPLSLMKYSGKYGWDVSVVSGLRPKNAANAGIKLENSIPDIVKIYRYKIKKNENPYLFPNVDGGFINALSMYVHAKNQLQHIPSVIISTAPSFFTFIAGYYLSRYYGSKLILDYRDEWTECPFDWTSKTSHDRKWERICLAHADAVVFTTQTQLNHQVSIFHSHLSADKCWVIPNGWDSDDFKQNGTLGLSQILSEQKYYISFVGGLGDHKIREFFYNLESILNKRSDIRDKLYFLFVGNKAVIANEYISNFPFKECIGTIDYVPKENAIQIMKNSTALLLLYDRNFQRYIPGRVYDYLAAGSPILIIGEEGEAVNLIKSLNAGIFIHESDTNALEKALDLIISGKYILMNNSSKESWLFNNTREMMARKYIDLVESL